MLLIVLSLQPDRELPSVRNHLQGPLMCHVTSSISSLGGVLLYYQVPGTIKGGLRRGGLKPSCGLAHARNVG